MAPSIVFVIGASGAGKTAVTEELERRALPGVETHHFDSVGVPTRPDPGSLPDGSDGWQAQTTRKWVGRLFNGGSASSIRILEGQTRPSFIVSALREHEVDDATIVLLDCGSETRRTRLERRGQPELANPQMDGWAAYLRGQADALGLRVIETDDKDVPGVVDELVEILREGVGPEQRTEARQPKAHPPQMDVPTSVDEYFARTLLPEDPVLMKVLSRSDEAGLPQEAVSPLQGMWLHIQTRSLRARRVLEVGTLGGYSTICMARALPKDGLIVTLEANEAHAQVARANFELAGLQNRIEVRLGKAIDSLDILIRESAAPFDLVFLDADKPNNPRYLERVMQLVRPGSLIIADNVVRDGEVAKTGSTDPKVQGVREYLAQAGGDPRLRTSALQTVGGKGYDGFAISIVTEAAERSK